MRAGGTTTPRLNAAAARENILDSLPLLDVCVAWGGCGGGEHDEATGGCSVRACERARPRCATRGRDDVLKALARTIQATKPPRRANIARPRVGRAASARDERPIRCRAAVQSGSKPCISATFAAKGRLREGLPVPGARITQGGRARGPERSSCMPREPARMKMQRTDALGLRPVSQSNGLGAGLRGHWGAPKPAMDTAADPVAFPPTSHAHIGPFPSLLFSPSHEAPAPRRRLGRPGWPGLPRRHPAGGRAQERRVLLHHPHGRGPAAPALGVDRPVSLSVCLLLALRVPPLRSESEQRPPALP